MSDLESRVERIEEELGIEDDEESGVLLHLRGVGDNEVLVAADGVVDISANTLPTSNPIEVQFEEDAVHSDCTKTGWSRDRLDEGVRGWNVEEIEVEVRE